MKYPAGAWMVGMANHLAVLLALQASNMLNDERLRLGRKAAAEITAGMTTLSKHGMFWKSARLLKMCLNRVSPLVLPDLTWTDRSCFFKEMQFILLFKSYIK